MHLVVQKWVVSINVMNWCGVFRELFDNVNEGYATHLRVIGSEFEHTVPIHAHSGQHVEGRLRFLYGSKSALTQERFAFKR